MPEFDILIPHYGGTAMLYEAVHSVLAQRRGGWRLTVVDDGGHNENLASGLAALGSPRRIRYLRNENNLGITRNFNRCLEWADRSHLVMMGNDDRLLPGYLDAVTETLERFPGAAVVQPGVRVVDGAGAPVRPLGDRVKRWQRKGGGTQALLAGEPLATSLMRGNWLYFPSLCWRTDAIRSFGFRTEFSVVQDLALVMDVLLDGGQLAVDPRICFEYRRHGLSVSSARAVDGRRFEEERRFFTEVADRLADHGWHRARRAADSHLTSRLHALTLLPTALRAGSRKAVPGLLKHAFG